MVKIATVKAKNLSIGFKQVSRAKGSNSVLQIIENVLIKTGKGHFVLTATNLDVTIVTGVAAEVSKEQFEFLVPYHAVSIINELPEETKLDVSHDAATNLIRINYGTDNVIDFEAVDTTNFPKTPTFESKLDITFENELSVLTGIFNLAAKFVSNDDLRPHLTGVLFNHKDIAATNSYRLIEVNYLSSMTEFTLLLRKQFIEALASLKPDYKNCKILSDYNYVAFQTNTTKVIGRLIDSKYPDYKVVIPKDKDLDIAIEFNRAELMSNLKLCKYVATASDKRITFVLQKDGTYNLIAANVDLKNTMNLKGSCTWQKNAGNAEGLTMNYNLSFLLETLEQLEKETIVFNMIDANKATVIKEDGYLFLLMPLNPVGEKAKK